MLTYGQTQPWATAQMISNKCIADVGSIANATTSAVSTGTAGTSVIVGQKPERKSSYTALATTHPLLKVIMIGQKQYIALIVQV